MEEDKNASSQPLPTWPDKCPQLQQLVPALTTHGPSKPTAAESHTHKQAYNLPSTQAHIEYLHATTGHPVKSSWLNAIKRKYYHSWLGLTYTTAAQFFPTTNATIKGCLAQSCRNIRSTTATPTITTNLAHLEHIGGPNTIDLLEILLSKISLPLQIQPHHLCLGRA